MWNNYTINEWMRPVTKNTSVITSCMTLLVFRIVVCYSMNDAHRWNIYNNHFSKCSCTHTHVCTLCLSSRLYHLLVCVSVTLLTQLLNYSEHLPKDGLCCFNTTSHMLLSCVRITHTQTNTQTDKQTHKHTDSQTHTHTQCELVSS